MRLGGLQVLEDPHPVGVYGTYRQRVEEGCEAGLTLDQLDDELLRDAPLDEDEKAALWLFGHALLDVPATADRPPSA
jgi:hypothetical protein